MKLFKYLFISLFLFSFSCTYVQKIKDGKTAFSQKQYSVAVDFLKRDYNKAKTMMDRGNIAFMLGESFQSMGQNSDAINWYLKAFENDYGADALAKYADGLKSDEQYDLAKKNYKEAGIQIGSPFEFRKKITACTIAKEWLNDKDNSGYRIENMKWNTSDADFSPVFYKSRLLISSDHNGMGATKYKWTGRDHMDLQTVDLESGNREKMPKPIVSDFNEATATFNSDYSMIIFTRCSGEENADQFCALYSSFKDGDNWSNPELLDFIESNTNYINPALNESNDVLYFASDNSDGWGGYDLYASFWDGEAWTSPKILSRAINTIGNEKFPFLEKDTLYFSSDYHPGMGGFDIFKSYKIDGKNWASVRNLKAPINSGGDDFGFIIQHDMDNPLGKGYFSSNRKGGMGNDDIYAFSQYIPEVKIVEIPKKDTIKKAIVYKMVLDGIVLEKIYKNDNPNGKIMGRKPLPEANLSILINGKSKLIKVGADGNFTLNLVDETDYLFTASKDGYLSKTARFSTKGIGKDKNNPIQHFEIEIVLDKIFKDREIVLDNIYYDFNKWNIRNDAKPTLIELSEILKQNPNIKIQLSSHTDCRGKNSSNLKLSQKRAQSAVDYLISLGIDSSRLTAKGYGEEFPAIGCKCQNCSDDEHQANRRTTFKIVN